MIIILITSRCLKLDICLPLWHSTWHLVTLASGVTLSWHYLSRWPLDTIGATWSDDNHICIEAAGSDLCLYRWSGLLNLGVRNESQSDSPKLQEFGIAIFFVPLVSVVSSIFPSYQGNDKKMTKLLLCCALCVQCCNAKEVPWCLKNKVSEWLRHVSRIVCLCIV